MTIISAGEGSSSGGVQEGRLCCQKFADRIADERKIFKTRIQQVEDKDGERRFFIWVTIAGKPIYRVRLGSFEGKDSLRALIFRDREVIFG